MRIMNPSLERAADVNMPEFSKSVGIYSREKQSNFDEKSFPSSNYTDIANYDS